MKCSKLLLSLVAVCGFTAANAGSCTMGVEPCYFDVGGEEGRLLSFPVNVTAGTTQVFNCTLTTYTADGSEPPAASATVRPAKSAHFKPTTISTSDQNFSLTVNISDKEVKEDSGKGDIKFGLLHAADLTAQGVTASVTCSAAAPAP